MLLWAAGAGSWRLWACLVAAVAIGALAPARPARAQSCGTDYTVVEGDTLAEIATRTYGDPTQWALILYANQGRLGGHGSLLVSGLALRLPCIGGTAPAALSAMANKPALSPLAELVIASEVRSVKLLTADGLPPFTGRALEGGGMMTELVGAAMGLIKDEAKGRFEFSIAWVNDWSAHLRPLLLTRTFDVGFPWTRPNCGAPDLDEASQFRCQRFLFSEPLYEEATRLFVPSGSRITGLGSQEIDGTTLCRAAGQPMHELDEQGRDWVKESRVTLIRPPTADDCFRLLASGAAHGVIEGELVGRASAASLGLAQQVRMIEQPLARTSYHVLISKAHPDAGTILSLVNASLQRLRTSGAYDRVVQKHLGRLWETQGIPWPAPNVKPAASSPPPNKQDAPSAPATPVPEGRTDVTRRF